MTMVRSASRFLFLGGVLWVAVGLTACQTTAENAPQIDRSTQIDNVLARAESEANAAGNEKDSLILLEKLYKRNSDDPDLAVRYARALREAGDVQKAALVIGPFARDEELKSADAKVEFASIQAAMGNYMLSEEFSRQAVLIDPEIGNAYHLLGIALDAQGHHAQAEVAFRKALDHWEGDPGAILNNLGLNLASQGFFDEALNILRKAEASSPGRQEIERNIRIVTALRNQKPAAEDVDAVRAPKPRHKPDA